MKGNNTYSKENNRELNVLQAVKLRPGMFIKESNTRGFIHLIQLLVFSLKSNSSDKIQLALKLCKDNTFKVKIKNAILHSIVEFISPSPEPQVWKSGSTFDLRCFMGFTISSRTKIQQKKMEYAIVSKGVNYELNQVEKESHSEKLSLEFELDPIIFRNLKLDVQLIRDECKQFVDSKPEFSMTIEDDRQENKTNEIFKIPFDSSGEV